jgi:CDP-paratose 2-epimerase
MLAPPGDCVLVTGSTGLIGSETVRHFGALGYRCIGVDNDLRATFFGPEASTAWNRELLERTVRGYRHLDLDVRDFAGLERIFRELGRDLALVVHAAAQPSHDWAAREPLIDFTINANGTLHLLELTRRHAADAVFVFTSTNKVYGDLPNTLPRRELATRFEIAESHPFAEHGIDETMSVDQSLHSLFGASKLAADALVQEYGRYFGLKTVVFRGGCLTGPAHSAAELHGFLSYLMQCALTGRPYTVYGYGGRQVRDNIHSHDLVTAFEHVLRAPPCGDRCGEVYNIGGSRHSHCSLLEAVDACERLSGRRMELRFETTPRRGDHAWYISDVRKFRDHYPEWDYSYGADDIYAELHDGLRARVGGVEVAR